MQKISFEQFKKFLDESNALAGFNMTTQLMQQLFSEVDPHKKGFLSLNDWTQAFGSFSQEEQAFLLFCTSLGASFSDVDSAFEYFLTFAKGTKKVGPKEFGEAVNSLVCNRFSAADVRAIWSAASGGGKTAALDQDAFRAQFDHIRFAGKSKMQTMRSTGKTTLCTQSSSTQQWESDVFEKVRSLMKSSPLTLKEIFMTWDKDGNGRISAVEFRNALRKLNLGLTSREIDKLMAKVDVNSDGMVDWSEFSAKFRPKGVDVLLASRVHTKMAHIKELMLLYMTSPKDAFRMFDSDNSGKLTYTDFAALVTQLFNKAREQQPAYPVVKDLFDVIDIRKDGIIDRIEWNQTFKGVLLLLALIFF